MRLSLITVALDPETGQFPAEPLDAVPGDVLSVVEHFFHFAGLPQLLLVVHHRVRESGAGRKAPGRPARTDPAAALSPAARERYEQLRAWRRGRAEADGVPVFVICNNRQLATIARLGPTTKQALRQVEGIGERKAGRYGAAILAITAGDGSDATMSAAESIGDDNAG